MTENKEPIIKMNSIYEKIINGKLNYKFFNYNILFLQEIEQEQKKTNPYDQCLFSKLNKKTKISKNGQKNHFNIVNYINNKIKKESILDSIKKNYLFNKI